MWTEPSKSQLSGTVLAINCAHGGFKAFRTDPHDIDNNGAFATCATLMFLLVGWFLILGALCEILTFYFPAKVPSWSTVQATWFVWSIQIWIEESFWQQNYEERLERRLTLGLTDADSLTMDNVQRGRLWTN